MGTPSAGNAIAAERERADASEARLVAFTAAAFGALLSRPEVRLGQDDKVAEDALRAGATMDMAWRRKRRGGAR